MDKIQASNIVKSTFEKPFDKNNYIKFIKELLNSFDTSKAFNQPLSVQRTRQSFIEYIKSFERIGRYKDGDAVIDLLIVYLKNNSSIEKARSMQRNFVAGYLKGDYGTTTMKEAALVAFVSPNTDDWRFSLVKMDYKFEKTAKGNTKVKEEFTPARRWSFLVGTHENSHTAQSRLVPLIADDTKNPTLAELEESFNIEKVTREFFEKYRELFLRTKEELDKTVNKNTVIKKDFEKKDVNTVNFAKKLLGQIVFLYFLQKKGWFGVQRDSEWGTGSKQFLREIFEKKHGSYNNFFNDILEPLFYEALRIDRSHDDHYYSRFNCKIPFLNGGLFDPMNGYDWVKTDILIPNELFSNSKKTKEGDTGDGILDIFDRYNFTVKEDEPLEKEVAIDPELLGKAYEKFNAIRPDNYAEFKNALKSGKKGDESKFNKQYGVYYTPREIVHYMCQQSLINYLHTELNDGIVTYEKIGDEQTDMYGNEGKTGQLDLTIEHNSKPITSKEDIETLIHFGEHVSENEAHVEKSGKETATYYYKIPDSIRNNADKIDEKLANIKVCDPAIGSGAFPVGMMSEIVRARNALTPFIKDNERTVYHFKRECIENTIYGVDIDPGAVEIAKLRLWLSLVVDEDDIKLIKPLPNLDYKIVCGNSLLGVEKNLFNDKLFGDIEILKPMFFNETNPTKKHEYKKQIDELIHQITGGLSQFDFTIFFSEVFNKKKGFDIVICNPPYIGESGHKEIFRLVAQGPLKEFYMGKMDYLYFFFHLALNISRINSVSAFITTNYLITATGAKKLRLDLKNRSIIRRLVNFNELKIFESAQGQHNMITIFSRGYSPKEESLNSITQRNGFATVNDLISILNRDDSHTLHYKVNQSNLYDGKDNNIRFSNLNDKSNKYQSIFNKIIQQSQPLINYCLINQGIVTGANFLTDKNKQKYKINDKNIGDGIFLITNDELNNMGLSSKDKNIIKPIFKNSDIFKYGTNTINNLNLINLRYTDRIDINDYPKLKKHLLPYKKLLFDRPQTGTLESAFNKGYWYVMTTSRKLDFDGPKIVVPYRNHKNIFGYNEIPWYGLTDIYYITSKNIDIHLKYVLALLNSKLYFLWLYHKGKRKGEVLELFYDPLSEIPIIIINKDKQKPFISVVDKILSITSTTDYLINQNKQDIVEELSKEIDNMIYKLYGLTNEEIKIVEGDN